MEEAKITWKPRKEQAIKLYGTELSHFARKVRLLIDHYSIPCEFVDIGNVAEAEQQKFAQNPLMKVPVLVDEDNWVLDSDHIASYLVDRFDGSDRFQVATKDVFNLNARAVMNGIMAEEVKILLAKRTGIPVENFPFFDKATASIKNGLSWLESHASRFDGDALSYREMHLVCMWDHLSHYATVSLEYTQIAKIVSEVSEAPLIRRSSPLGAKPA